MTEIELFRKILERMRQTYSLTVVVHLRRLLNHMMGGQSYEGKGKIHREVSIRNNAPENRD